MPIGLPNHLAPRYAVRAYASAMHVTALACLVFAVLEITVFWSARPGLILWPALVALVPLFVLLFFLDRRRTVFYAGAYLAVGAVALYWYAIVGTFELRVEGATNALIFSLPKLALIFVGAGRTAPRMIAWALAGGLVGEAAVALGALQSGAKITVDPTTAIPVFVLVVAIIVVEYTRRTALRAQPAFARAQRDEHLAQARDRLEARAAAIMHDTALGHLSFVASAQPGELPASTRARMTRDLALLVGEEWLLDDAPTAPGVAWAQSPLFEAIATSREEGLDVEVSGDPSAVARLAGPQATALGLAARQCLINVIRHAGVDRAQIVLYGAEEAVSVMILDEGVGFDVDGTAGDRLGLKQSVRRRIESVGGSVRVWSTPGLGTSVVIGVPTSGAHAVVES
jgi:hypothetical protein